LAADISFGVIHGRASPKAILQVTAQLAPAGINIIMKPQNRDSPAIYIVFEFNPGRTGMPRVDAWHSVSNWSRNLAASALIFSNSEAAIAGYQRH